MWGAGLRQVDRSAPLDVPRPWMYPMLERAGEHCPPSRCRILQAGRATPEAETSAPSLRAPSTDGRA